VFGVVGCVGVVCGWGVWGVWGVWLGVYESDWWGVSVVRTHNPTHLTTGHGGLVGWWVGGCEAETIMGREASVVKQHTQQTHTPTVHTLTGWISTWFGVGWLD